MKRLVVGLLVVSFLVSATSRIAHAEVSNRTTLTVRGIIKDSGIPSGGSLMTLSCARHYVDTTHTDTTGYYSFVVQNADCPIGAIVGVFAYKGGKSGTASSILQGTPLTLNIDIAGTAIPEYTWPSVVLGGGVAIGAIGLARRGSKERKRSLRE